MPTPSAPPADLSLRPGTAVLDRGDGQVQLGTDLRWSLIVDGLDPHEVQWLCTVPVRRHAPLDRTARRHGVSDDRRREIVTLLTDCGFLVPPPRAAPGVLAVAGGAADAPALAALRPDGDGMAALARRATATVGIVGLGRIGASIATHLAAAGVGTLLLDDTGPVQVTDLGVGPYAQDDVGFRRSERLASALGDSFPRVAARARWRDEAPPSVVVVVSEHVDRPEAFARLVSFGVPHLSIVVGEADVLLGPLVLPGLTACTGCRHQDATDADEAWPRLSTQLRALPGDRAHETVLAVTAGALAVGQVLAHLDGGRPALCDAVATVRLPDALPRVRPLKPHPDCACTAPPR